MDDFASAALADLIVGSLKRQGREAPISRGPHPGARVALKTKQEILAWAAETHGSEAILQIGLDVRHAPFHPILHVLLSAPTARDLIERWLRLERYFHSRHRLRLEHADRNSVQLRHVWITPQAPSAPEDLLIAGLLAGLLIAQGCRGVSVAPAHDGADRRWIEKGRIALARRDAALPTDLWCLSWTREPGHAGEIEQTAKLSRLHRLDARHNLVTRRAASLLGEDLMHRWTLSELIAAARLREHCRLLEATSMPISSIGFLAGYADAAHAAREFKRGSGVTAGEYRAIRQRARA